MVSGMKHCSAVRRATSRIVPLILVTCGDVQEAQLVRASGVIDLGLLDRITGVDQVNEVDALDDTAVLDVEAGYDAGLQHARLLTGLAPPDKRYGTRLQSVWQVYGPGMAGVWLETRPFVIRLVAAGTCCVADTRKCIAGDRDVERHDQRKVETPTQIVSTHPGRERNRAI